MMMIAQVLTHFKWRGALEVSPNSELTGMLN